MEEDLESVAEPFVENLEDPEAKVVKRIVKSFVKLPEVVTEPFIENLEDPEVAKSRKSIINSIIERRAKKPNYT